MIKFTYFVRALSVGILILGVSANAADKPAPINTKPPAAAKVGTKTSNSGIGYPTVAAALKAVTSRKDIQTAEQGGWTLANDPTTMTLWSFTPSNHPAHPSAVRRRIVEKDGAVSITMDVLCEAKTPACEKLITDFDAINAGLGKSFGTTPTAAGKN